MLRSFLDEFDCVRFIGRILLYNKGIKRNGGNIMKIRFLRSFFCGNTPERMLDAQVRPFRKQLRLAGLNEDELRRMDPDERVAVLEGAKLNPFDYIYLAC